MGRALINEDERAALVAEIRAAWPDHAMNEAKVPVPAVREGGLTATLIDLAVDMTLKAVARD